MIINLIKNFLTKHKNGVTLNELEIYLANKKIKNPALELIYQSNVFKLYNGMIFLKSTLIKYKEDFLKEFDDYLLGKVTNKNLRDNIINYLFASIPEFFFIKWLNISLERKILIFELLLNMLLKPKKIKDKLIIFFNNLIEYYSIIVIYSILLFNNTQEDLNILLKNINDIESYENLIKIDFFKALSEPEIVKSKINDFEKRLKKIKNDLQNIFKNIFMPCYQFSPKLLNRILNNEFKNFEFIILLSRFEYESFYEWISSLAEENNQPNHNLFKDLGF